MTAANAPLLARLETIVGAANVLTDATSCSLYAQDVFTKALPALAVIRPGTVTALQQAVEAVTTAGHAIIPRGGGMSYTSGYVPTETGSVIVDMGGLNRILEINAEDMYVTVEAGCTWAALHDALEGTGLRTPYWGTLSGIKATVGGGMSQNSIFWGSGQYGSAADSVIAMTVVLADGTLLETGSSAQLHATPFFRHFGPDLTGLFTADNGAFGFKATITLRLIPALGARRFASYAFETHAAMIPAMSDIARAGLAMECFGFDPFLQSQRLKRESLAADVKALAGVVKASGSVLGAVKDAAKLALAGRRFMADVAFSFHVMVEERTEAAAENAIERATAIAIAHGGRVLENSIPKLTRANPFGPVNNMVGPDGERWVPIHALLPHSKALPCMERLEAAIATHQAAIDQFDIGIGFLFATVATNCFCIEPVLFWPDAMTEIHRASIEPAALKRMKGFPEDLAARAAAAELRQAFAVVFHDLGAVHLQVAKAYRYRDGIAPASFGLVEAVKRAVDPQGRVNPGALGL